MADRAGETDERPAPPDIQDLGRRADAVADPRITVQVYAGFDALPAGVTAFLDAAAERSFFCGIPWFRTLLQSAGPSDDEPRIYVADSGGRPLAVVIARAR